MRKEVFLAILAGSILGLILAFGIWRANSVLKLNPKNSKVAVNATPAADFKIVIAKPLNNQVLGDTPITISGVTKSNAYVVVTGSESDAITTAEKDGKFAIDADLDGGANQIKVFAFEDNGSAAQAQLTLVYSTEFVKDKSTEEDKTATTSDEVRQKVIEKLQDATKPGIAMYGVVTDITDGTIQIKSQTGEIQQIGFDKTSAVFLKSGKTTKTIKPNDVAIGDFIIAMGTKTGNAFTATRILVTDALTDSQIKASFGTITIARNKLTIKNPKTNEEVAFNVDSDTVFTSLDTKLKVKKLADLDDGDLVIVTGQDSARTVFLVTPTSTPKK